MMSDVDSDETSNSSFFNSLTTASSSEDSLLDMGVKVLMSKMANYRTARFWRFHLPSSRSRRDSYSFRKIKRKKFAKNEELNKLLLKIFAKFYFEDESLSYKYVVSFLTFEYFTAKPKLSVSLTLKGKVYVLIDVFEENEIIQIFKALFKRNIPCSVANILNGINLESLYDITLSVIAVTSGKTTTSVYCNLNSQKYLFNEGSLREPSGTTQVPPSTAMEIEEGGRAPFKGLDSFMSEDVRRTVMIKLGQNEELMHDDTPEHEVKFRKFIAMQEAPNRAFIFSRDVEGMAVHLVCAIITEENMSSVYALDNCSDVGECLVDLTRGETSLFSEYKFFECPVDNGAIFDECHLDNGAILESPVDHRAMLDECIFRLFEALVLDTNFMDVKYTVLSLEDFDLKDVFQLMTRPLPSVDEPWDAIEIPKIGDILLLWKDLETIKGCNWLNDTVIDGYLNLIMLRSKSYPETLPLVYNANTFFLPRALNARYPRKSKLANFITADLVLIPSNDNRTHWSLYCIDNRTHRIMHYDSLPTPEDERKIEALLRFMFHLSKSCPEQAHDPNLYQYSREEAVPQRTTYDCGMFLLMHAEFLSRDEAFCFSQDNMRRIRKRVQNELLTRNIIPVHYKPKAVKIRKRFDGSEYLLSFSEKQAVSVEAIEDFFALLVKRSITYSAFFPSVGFLKACFLNDLQAGRVRPEDYKAVLQTQLVFFPLLLTEPQKKCVLFCIDNQRRSILCYNPVDGQEYPRVLQQIEDFLESVRGSKLSYHKGSGEAVKTTETLDSDLLVMLQGEFLSRHATFTSPSENASDLRKTLFYQIGFGALRFALPSICPTHFKELPSKQPIPFDHTWFPYSDGIKLSPEIMRTYLDFLRREYEVWVHPIDKLLVEDGRDRFFVMENEKSWCLVAVRPTEKVVYYYNITPIRDTLENLRLMHWISNVMLDTYNTKQLPFSELRCDSGVYVLSSIYCLAKGLEPDFEEHNVSYLRKKICWELKHDSPVPPDSDTEIPNEVQ